MEKCGKWIHDGCAGVKRIFQRCSEDFACSRFEGRISMTVELEERSYVNVKMVMDIIYFFIDIAHVVDMKLA